MKAATGATPSAQRRVFEENFMMQSIIATVWVFDNVVSEVVVSKKQFEWVLNTSTTILLRFANGIG